MNATRATGRTPEQVCAALHVRMREIEARATATLPALPPDALDQARAAVRRVNEGVAAILRGRRVTCRMGARQ